MSTRKSTFFYSVLIAFVSVVVGMVIASRLDLAPGSFASTLTVPARNSAPLTGAIDATTFRTIAKQASPAVVSIVVKSTRPPGEAEDDSPFPFDLPFPFNRQPQGRQRQPAPELQRGAGSGFIIDKAGYILTNNHVVENAKSIDVFLSNTDDDTEGLAAKVVGRDELTDVALLQLIEMPKEPLQAAQFGDSDQMAPGDWVMAIGNPFTLANTVTVGVVSATGRHQPSSHRGRSEDFIQTDAAINPGNSGGPLLNIRGEVIGINAMIYSTQSALGGEAGNIGIGFAIPINTVSELLPALKTGKVTRGRIGVMIGPITEDMASDLGLPGKSGALVSRVDDGPAKTAGVKVGDVITEFNGKPVKDSNDLVNAVTRTTPGTTVPLKVVRDKRNLTLNVKVEELDLAAETPTQSAQSESTSPDASKDTDLGMSLQTLTPRLQRGLQVPDGRSGAVVSDVTPLGPADEAGINQGDVILSVQGQAVHNADEAARALAAVAAGHTARVVIWQREQNGQGNEVLVQIRKR